MTRCDCPICYNAGGCRREPEPEQLAKAGAERPARCRSCWYSPGVHRPPPGSRP